MLDFCCPQTFYFLSVGQYRELQVLVVGQTVLGQGWHWIPLLSGRRGRALRMLYISVSSLTFPIQLSLSQSIQILFKINTKHVFSAIWLLPYPSFSFLFFLWCLCVSLSTTLGLLE